MGDVQAVEQGAETRVSTLHDSIQLDQPVTYTRERAQTVKLGNYRLSTVYTVCASREKITLSVAEVDMGSSIYTILGKEMNKK